MFIHRNQGAQLVSVDEFGVHDEQRCSEALRHRCVRILAEEGAELFGQGAASHAISLREDILVLDAGEPGGEAVVVVAKTGIPAMDDA